MSHLCIAIALTAATLAVLLAGRLFQALCVLRAIDAQLDVELLAQLAPAQRQRHLRYMEEAGFLLD